MAWVGGSLLHALSSLGLMAASEHQALLRAGWGGREVKDSPPSSTNTHHDTLPSTHPPPCLSGGSRHPSAHLDSHRMNALHPGLAHHSSGALPEHKEASLGICQELQGTHKGGTCTILLWGQVGRVSLPSRPAGQQGLSRMMMAVPSMHAQKGE